MTNEPAMSMGLNELARMLCLDMQSNTEVEERLSRMLDTLHDQVVLLDARGVVVYINKATEHLTGYNRDEVLGSTPALWRLSESATHVERKLDIREDSRAPEHDVIRNVRKDGTVYEATVRSVPVSREDGSPSYTLLVERDVSDAAALERVQRRIAALTSHNLKTPLASMRWQLEMLRNGDMGHVSQEQQESLAEIHEGVTRMVGMVEQWYTVTNLDLGLHTLHSEKIPLENLVAEVLHELQLRIEQEEVSVRFSAHPVPFVLEADRDTVRTIVHALIFNAVKYNRANGTVDVEVLPLPNGDEYDGRSFSEDRVLLSVRDTGQGIPTGEQGRVFLERFHASNVEASYAAGAGLDLYITRALVQKLCGDIWFSSSEEGSHFVVAFPNVLQAQHA